jgi:hypothetical protein
VTDGQQHLTDPNNTCAQIEEQLRTFSFKDPDGLWTEVPWWKDGRI